MEKTEYVGTQGSANRVMQNGQEVRKDLPRLAQAIFEANTPKKALQVEMQIVDQIILVKRETDQESTTIVKVLKAVMAYSEESTQLESGNEIEKSRGTEAECQLKEMTHAVIHADCKRVGKLLDSGVSIEVKRNGKTPLLIAAEQYQYATQEYGRLESRQENRQKMFEYLLEHGADVTAADDRGWTALHHIAKAGLVDMASKLLEFGASLEAKTKDGKTVLHAAVCGLSSFHLEEHPKMIRFLIEQGLSPNDVDHKRYGALHLAIQKRDNWPAQSYFECIEALVDGDAEINKTTRRGETALDLALKHHVCNRKEVAKFLKKLGAKTSADLCKEVEI